MESDSQERVYVIANNGTSDYIVFLEAHYNGFYAPLLLCIVIGSLLENVFLVLLTIKPLNRLCYLRRRRKRFAFLARTRANITSLAYSIQTTVVPFPTQVIVQNSEPGLYKKSVDSQLTIPHPLLPHQRHRCRYRYISAESSEMCRYHSLHRSTFYYFSSLCISIAILMCVTLSNLLIEFKQCKGNSVAVDKRHAIQCHLVEIFTTALIMVMSFSLVELTTDRLIAICRPFHYWRLMSCRKCIFVIIAGWLVSISFALIPYIYLGFKGKELAKGLRYCFVVGIKGLKSSYLYAYVYITLVFLFPLCFILWAYAKIHRIVGRSADVHEENHARYMRQTNCRNTMPDSIRMLKNYHIQCRSCKGEYLEPPLIRACESAASPAVSGCRFFANFSSIGCNPLSENREGAQNLNDYLKKAKATKSALLIVSSFYGLTLPYMCMICYQAVRIEYTKWENAWLDRFEAVSIVLLYTATIITPMIYAIRDGALSKRLNCFFRNVKLLCAKKSIPPLPDGKRNITFLPN